MDAHKKPAGFTLIELLVVMAIIGLLVAILLPTLAASKRMAKEAATLSAMRQMLIGYTLYQHDYGLHLPWGYPPSTVNGTPLTVSLPSGHVIVATALPIVQRYPLRLVPYQQDVWEILYNHTAPPSRPKIGDSQATAEMKAYQLSVNPSFGLNTVFLGGDRDFGGFIGDRPNYGQHVVFRSEDVKRPSEMITFADAKFRGGITTTGDTGFHRLTPPVAAGQRWQVVGETIQPSTTLEMGIPEGRYSRSTVTGFFDGHAGRMKPADLENMRLWANNATTETYDYVSP